MTFAQFLGCGTIAFGPAIAMFALTIALNPIRVILILTSSFFWLLSLVCSSVLYTAVVPLQDIVAFGAISSVIFQEIFRFLWFITLKKIGGFLKKFTLTNVELSDSKHALAYVSGLGFGIMSGVFSLLNVLHDMTGPGTVGIHGDSPNFFITSAVTAMAFIFHQIFWSVIFFNGLDQKVYTHVAYVVLSHLAATSVTLLNPLYAATVTIVWILTILSGIFAFKICGGTLANLKQSVQRNPPITVEVDVSEHDNHAHAT